MKKLPVFTVLITSASILINVYPAIIGFKAQPFNSISLVSSTIAWLSYLYSLYFLSSEGNRRTLLTGLNILLLVTILLPLYDVFSKSPENIELASKGFLSGLYVFMNYVSRISLLLFSISILTQKEFTLRIAMIILSGLIFTSFLTCVYEWFVLFNNTEPLTLYTWIARTIDPFAILALFLLQLYLIINRKVVINSQSSNSISK